ncbi:MAG: DUF6240 domain-containing protein [Agathobacter sp.]
MQIDQTSIQKDIDRKIAENGQGIFAYIKEDAKVSGVTTEQYKKSEEVSSSGSISMSDATYIRPEHEKEKKNPAQQLVKEGNLTAEARRNEMAVIANTTTPEDLSKMQEDGFSISDMKGSTIVTVTDKIKVALAKGGGDVSFGSTMSEEEIAEITGNASVAAQIADALEQKDLPATTENVEDAKAAFEEARSIEGLEASAIQYLIKNELPPTIENLYRAQHSYGESSDVRNKNAISDEEFDGMKEQIHRIIEKAGLSVTDETENDARYLLENHMLLTKENLAYYESLKQLGNQNFSDGHILSSITDAISEGKRPLEGILMEEYTLFGQAKEAVSVIEEAREEDLVYLIDEGEELTVSNLKTAIANRGTKSLSEGGLALLTAKRQLEEARLAMTAEANYALLKKGVSIDTKPLVDLVEDLKQQENSYYKDLLNQAGVEATEEKVTLFATTTEQIQDLKTSPANILSVEPWEETITTLHEKGEALKADYEKANERYETLMTSPRADLGDSMKKAFRNVDDILKDLNLECSEANRRAVRILAYNRTEITSENIALMKAKDEEVQRLFSNMTPKVTLELIRKGVNPLDMNVNELNQAAEEIKSEFTETDNERFEKFLWKLEQNKQISEEERTSYIGIYRLIAQVEKTDGAAIGSLINQDATLTMRNLLSAVRSQKKGSMDYEVNDSFEGVTAKTEGARIDEQILAAYQTSCVKDAAENLTIAAVSEIEKTWQDLTPEQLKEAALSANSKQAEDELEIAYQKNQLQQFTEVLSASEDIYTYLEQNDIPNTMSNILAVTQMFRNPNRMFERLFTPHSKENQSIEKVRELKEQVIERFAEAIKSPTEMAEAQETLADIAEHVMDTMIIEDEQVSAVDLRELRLLNKQLSLCAKQSREECYMIPIETGEGVTGVSLKILRGEEKKGLVDILFRGSLMGKVAASFEAKEDSISGMIATDDEQTRQLLSENLGLLAEKLNEQQDEKVDLRVAYIPDLSLEHYAVNLKWSERKPAAAGEKNPVQTTRLYHIAESFIQTIQDLDHI